MPEFLQFTFSGLTVGAVYALVALGFTLIYNSSDVINFAQGEFVMLGGMTTVFLGLTEDPLPLAACLAIVFTVIVGLALHRFAIEPARGASAVVLIIITIGASISCAAPRRWFSTSAFTACRPGSATIPSVSGAPPSCRRAWWCSPARSSLSCCCGLSSIAPCWARRLHCRKPARGAPRGHQPAPHRRALVRHFRGDRGGGRHPDRTHHADKLRRRHAAGAQEFRRRNARRHAGSALGAVVGGLLLGLLEAFAAGYLSSQYKDAVAFLVILIVLFAMPRGLFGRASVERV